MENNKQNHNVYKKKSKSKNLFTSCFGWGQNNHNINDFNKSRLKTKQINSNLQKLKQSDINCSSTMIHQKNGDQLSAEMPENIPFLAKPSLVSIKKSKLTLENKQIFTEKEHNDINNNQELVKKILNNYLNTKNKSIINSQEKEIITIKTSTEENEFSSESTIDSIFNPFDTKTDMSESDLRKIVKEKPIKQNLEVVFTHSTEILPTSTKVESDLAFAEVPLQYKISCDGTPTVIGTFSTQELSQKHCNKSKVTACVPLQELYLTPQVSKQSGLLRSEEPGASLKWKLIISNHKGSLLM